MRLALMISTSLFVGLPSCSSGSSGGTRARDDSGVGPDGGRIPDSGGPDATDPCGSAGIHGAKMVLISADNGKRFCIDERKTSVAEYGEFLAAGVSPSSSPDCETNLELEVPTGDSYCTDGPGDWPVRCIDPCDARSFCSWAGKRLCGRTDAMSPADALVDIGGGGAVSTPGSEWYQACAATTDVGDAGGVTPCAQWYEPVGSSCGGHATSVFDFFAYPMEWTSDCEVQISGQPSCVLRGGYDEYGCSAAHVGPDIGGVPFAGIRCCADIPGGSG